MPKIFVGKAPGNHHASQDSINDMLVRLARAGHRVVRLKGGDPFVFGRGGEEALHLVRHGVAFEVVPGITAALACGAYAGIPLTHRGLARHLHFVAGHCRGDVPLDLDWQALADPEATLVFYMALMNLDEVRERLLNAGLASDTPASLVESGTTRQQTLRKHHVGRHGACGPRAPDRISRRGHYRARSRAGAGTRLVHAPGRTAAGTAGRQRTFVCIARISSRNAIIRQHWCWRRCWCRSLPVRSLRPSARHSSCICFSTTAGPATAYASPAAWGHR